MPTPITPPDRIPVPGTGIVDDQATEWSDWDDAEAADWDPAEPADWDPAESADWDSAELGNWDPEDAEGGSLEPAMPGPETLDAEPSDAEPSDAEPSDAESSDAEPLDPDAERRGPGCAEDESREASKAAPRAQTSSDGGWFAAGGVADNLLPGPRLAEFMADAGAIGLGRLTDDELIGVMRAARRMASWSAAMELAAAGDLWRRRWAEERAGGIGAACHADDEIAAALTLTRRAADQLLSLAVALRGLPLTSRALIAGDIDLPRAMVIADEVTGLGNEHAAAVEQVVIGAAAGQTTGQLRATTRRAVLSADPRAARKRKERALQDARVERWNEHGGTAALAGRDLPPASVLAADKNLSALARQLKRAGAPGTLDQLRAQVYVALLTGTSVGSLIPTEPGTASGTSADATSRNYPGLTGDSPAGTTPAGFGPHARPSAFGGLGVPAGRGLAGGAGVSASPGIPITAGTAGISGGLFAGGTVNLTMPLVTWLGLSDAPGNVAGYGPLDADESRAIAGALSARAGTKWCLTLTDSHGRLVAHGCARAGPSPGQHRVGWPTGPPGAHGPGSGAGPGGGARAGPGSGAPSTPQTRAPDRTWTFNLTLLAGGDCDHARETAAYRPSPGLRHLIEVRHATCTYPGCRRPTVHCDADHTVAYHRGGRTCLCNLAPLCRHHHEVKQSSGWRLDQASPGFMTWTMPTGRRYAVGPSDYPG